MKIVFITSCKPLNNEKIEIIQKNSIGSWLSLNIEKEIYVFNKDESVKKMCESFNVTIVEDYECSDYSDIPTWRTMKEYASNICTANDVIVWVNSDVMFDNTLIETITSINLETNDFVLVGQKLDWHNYFLLNGNYNFSNLSNLELHGEWAIDYFIFKKHLFNNIPPFYIARMRFDNYLMSKSIKDYIAIDCTNTINCIHHRHDYGKNIDSIFSEIYNTDYWQNEQKINDSIISGNLSNIKHCLFYTKKENNIIQIIKK